MRNGKVNAIAALLIAGSWATAQAPLPMSYFDNGGAAPPVKPSAVASPAAAASPAQATPVHFAPAAQPDEAISAPPTPSIVPPPSAAAGVEPVTNVLPRGNFVDPAVIRPYTVWGSADFLMWRINNGQVPQVNGPVPVGVLTVQTYDYLQTVNNNGSVSTVVQRDPLTGYFPLTVQDVPSLPNGGNADLGDHMGGRFDAGVWLTPDHVCGIEGNFFYLQQRGILLQNGTNNANNQVLYTTPFVNNVYTVTPGTTTIEPGTPPIETTTPATRSLVSTIPIIFTRQLDTTLTAGLSNSLWGTQLQAVSALTYVGPTAVGGLVGFRMVQFTEDLDMNGTFNFTTPTDLPESSRPANLPAAIAIQTHDGVAAKNYFYGGNIGLDFDTDVGGFFVDLRTQVAMGGIHQRVDISSYTNTAMTATPYAAASATTTQGGLLFNQLDNGTHKRDEISFLPELNLRAGYQFCSWFRGYVGYDALYLSNVLRAGNVVAPETTSGSLQNSNSPSAPSTSTSTGVTNLTVTQPSFRFADSNIWTQGFNFGFELTF